MLDAIKDKLMSAWTYLKTKFDETELKTGMIALLVAVILLYCLAFVSDILVLCVVALALAFVVYKLYVKYKEKHVQADSTNADSSLG